MMSCLGDDVLPLYEEALALREAVVIEIVSTGAAVWPMYNSDTSLRRFEPGKAQEAGQRQF